MAKALRTETCTRERLEEIAARPGHTVYQYTNDTPEAIMSGSDQQALAKQIIAHFDMCCERYPNACDESLRERVLNGPGNVRLFQRLFAKTFAAVTRRVVDAEDLAQMDRCRKGLLVMVQTRAESQLNEESKTAAVMHLCMRLAMRDAKPEDLENAQQMRMAGTEAGDAGDGDDGDEGGGARAAELPPVTPLDPMALGDLMVHQGGLPPQVRPRAGRK